MTFLHSIEPDPQEVGLSLILLTEKNVGHRAVCVFGRILPEEAAVLKAEVKEWVTLTYFRHRENLHVGPGSALIRRHPSET